MAQPTGEIEHPLRDGEEVHSVPLLRCQKCDSPKGVFLRCEDGLEWVRCASCGSGGPDEIAQPARPVSLAQASTSGQFHAGLPPTVQRGSGSTPRLRQMSTVGRLTPSLAATSAMPTGSQFSMSNTVTNILTDDQGCSDNHYMTELATIDVAEVQDPHELRESRPYSDSHVDYCFLCGRGITSKGMSRTTWVHLAGGGSVLVAVDLGPVEADMGWFPVGPECAKRVPPNFRAASAEPDLSGSSGGGSVS